ncbi:iron ABC transporter substrate-binding protein [Nocardioides sp. Y6]|uniref:Iron ABC transporter substrate-binding protein n=1 Tax=Nocardioides malaquae TaxID=2773426 RepID=A0ABR9RPB4_9ACTN|nr:iron ABC transporter substrate-binding protein [Nocardioides malaquae]MBE7323413.1 iron ABC transporter substrate-binding protein [Nocardioides malaquae]
MNSRTRRLRLGALLAALTLAPLAACSSEGDDDTLVVYVGRDEGLVGPLLKQFTDETDIEVDARYTATPDALALLLEEGEDTPADVFVSQDAGALGALSEAGMLQTLPEEITGQVPAQFTSADDTWVGLTARARVIAYNSEKLDEDQVPTTVGALTDEKWAGRVGFPPGNASFQAFVTGFRAAEGDDAARQWLTDMVANDVQTFENNLDTLEAIENGTVDLGLINHYYLFGLRAELGAENVVTELKFPEAGDPGALVNVTGAATLSDHPDAEALVEWLVAEDAQQYFAEETFEYPLLPGVEAPEGLPELTSLKGPLEDLAELEDLEATLAMLEEVGLS